MVSKGVAGPNTVHSQKKKTQKEIEEKRDGLKRFGARAWERKRGVNRKTDESCVNGGKHERKKGGKDDKRQQRPSKTRPWRGQRNAHMGGPRRTYAWGGGISRIWGSSKIRKKKTPQFRANAGVGYQKGTKRRVGPCIKNKKNLVRQTTWVRGTEGETEKEKGIAFKSKFPEYERWTTINGHWSIRQKEHGCQLTVQKQKKDLRGGTFEERGQVGKLGTEWIKNRANDIVTKPKGGFQ